MEAASRNSPTRHNPTYPYSAPKSRRFRPAAGGHGEYPVESDTPAHRGAVGIQVRQRLRHGKQRPTLFPTTGLTTALVGTENDTVSPLRANDETGGPRFGLFEPDIVLPSQFFATMIGSAAHKRGECQLLIAILEDAVRCFQKYLFAQSRGERRLFEDAEQWLMGPDATLREDERPAFSFAYICQAIDLDADYLRDGLRRWRNHQLERASLPRPGMPGRSAVAAAG